MKLTNGEIYNAREPLEELLKQKLPLKASYGLAKLAPKINEQFQVIEMVRQGLFQTYGEPDPDNMRRLRVDPQSKNFPKFASELGELMSQEVEIVFEVVTLPDKVTSVCEKCGHTIETALQIEPTILIALDKFIKVE